MSEEIATIQCKEAWDRIARTADGQIIYRHLQRIRLGMAPALEGGALRHNEGRRSLAADLMAYMAEGIADSDRYAVTFAVAKPIAVTGERGAGRRVNEHSFVPGWSIPGDDEPATNVGPGGDAT